MSRLLYLVNDLDFFRTHRLALAQAALAESWEVGVAAPFHPEAARLAQSGFTVHTIPLGRRSMSPLAELRSLVAIWRLLRQERPDLLHTITIKPTIYGGIAARLAGTPRTVATITGLGYVFSPGSPRAWLLRSLARAAYRLALRRPSVRVIFQNPDDLALFTADGMVAPKQTALVLGSGVDLQEFRPQPEPPPPVCVILPSRLLWDKGVGEFVQAARMLRERGVAARMVLVGRPDPGNPSSVDEAQLSRWAQEGAVEWWGFRGDMPQVLAQSHIVCLPSYYREGIPRVLIEAAACGRPVVSTDAPGCREIARAGENGLLVPVRDAPALADALQRLIGDPALRRRMGARGREIVEREFALPIVIAQTLAVYEELRADVETGSR
ncbi:MAG: glycosyltransferase family 4 protein [Candidatus Lambdaproteobacteria bacterium]|nr:glycosyltransferase family 4 protein [Candidatus Lambdaproteobacteria bacterium]